MTSAPLAALAEEFRTWDISALDAYRARLSTKCDDGTSFPPYIPLVGKNYEEERVLIYATAQMIPTENDVARSYAAHFDKLVERLSWSRDFVRHYPDALEYKDVEIAPWKAGVLPALAGIFLLCWHGQAFESLADIQDRVAVSNYYKFSLYGKKDINPNSLNDGEEYWKLNDELVSHELAVLRPSCIIVFRGRHVDKLKQYGAANKCRIVLINDPAWVLRGASGALSQDGSWAVVAQKVTDSSALALVQHYTTKNCLCDKYTGKPDAVRNYLLKYYADWMAELAAERRLPL